MQAAAPREPTKQRTPSPARHSTPGSSTKISTMFSTANSSPSARRSLTPVTFRRRSAMTTYNVHIYRELYATFSDVEADSPEDAASTARGFATGSADRIDDGADLSARVHATGAENFRQSVTID